MSLYEMLPLLEGWRYWDVREPKLGAGILKHGESRDLFVVENQKGWVLYAALYFEGSLDAKYTHIQIWIDYPTKPFTLEFSPYDLYRYGNVRMLNFGVYVQVYDDTNKVYTVVMDNVLPLPFNQSFKITITAPPTVVEDSSDIVYSGHGGYIQIYDEEAFKESLWRLLYPPQRLPEKGRVIPIPVR